MTAPLHSLVAANGTGAVILRIMLGFNFAVVNPVLQLDTLQRILHLLLISLANVKSLNDLVDVTSSRNLTYIVKWWWIRRRRMARSLILVFAITVLVT